jgi:uncharacterized protein YqjF (DUF2071 family)
VSNFNALIEVHSDSEYGPDSAEVGVLSISQRTVWEYVRLMDLVKATLREVPVVHDMRIWDYNLACTTWEALKGAGLGEFKEALYSEGLVSLVAPVPQLPVWMKIDYGFAHITPNSVHWRVTEKHSDIEVASSELHRRQLEIFLAKGDG